VNLVPPDKAGCDATSYLVDYTCAGCNLGRGRVRVRYRQADETVVAYFESVVMKAIITDHLIMAPVCSKNVDNIMIPIMAVNDAGQAAIGYAPRESAQKPSSDTYSFLRVRPP
jgi:hypothetical protein